MISCGNEADDGAHAGDDAVEHEALQPRSAVDGGQARSSTTTVQAPGCHRPNSALAGSGSSRQCLELFERLQRLFGGFERRSSNSLHGLVVLLASPV